MSKLPYSCIIGAGSSGVTTAKALIERGLPFDCFDRSDDIGGNWYFNPLYCRSAFRNRLAPGNRLHGLGFHVARVRTGQ